MSLVVGGLLGLRVDQALTPQADGPTTVRLHAGSVVAVPACASRCLRLPLFNDGRQPVTVTAVGFDGWAVRAVTTPFVVRPHAWAEAWLDLPRDCTAPRPQTYRSVQVQVSVGGVLEKRSLRLPRATPQIRADRDRQCPEGRPADPPGARGLWVLEEVRSAWPDEVERLLKRAGAEGTFPWDARSQVDDPQQRVRGRYRLAHGRLTVLLRNMNLCHTNDVPVWRVMVADVDPPNLRRDRGVPRYCGAPAGELWVARRVRVKGPPTETRALVNAR